MTKPNEQPELPFLVSKPQLRFITAQERHPLLLAGFGAGKTVAGIVRALLLKCAYPKQDVGYYLPTYDLVKSIGYPGFLEVMDAMGIAGEPNRSDRTLTIRGAGNIIFRSMDRPERIVGYKHADAVVDELDTLGKEQARQVWNKIIARNRQKKPDGSLNTVAAVTTPEGFRFVYDRWQKNPARGYRIIRASTFSNARNLPEGYIDSLYESYPTALLQAYVEGLFCNLTSGSVYPEFDRNANDTQEAIQENEPLHIGMDFNVSNMAAIIHVQRDGKPHAVGELVKVYDTPAMIKLIKERYEKHPVLVYPDASGKSRKSVNASESDLALLRQARFTVCVNPRNPAVKDRVLAMNGMICKDGKRDYRVSQDRCPVYVESLEQQAYDANGEPDKTSGHDHANDAGGYYIAHRFPIRRPTTAITALRM